MSLWLIILIAVMTYASRALALVALPDPPPAFRRVLDRVPAPLFAALAAVSLLDDGEIVDVHTLTATVGGLVMSPTRSLLKVLLGGVAGFLLSHVLF
jgi:branched-subunit amino acid transport protein